jgi:hypothetical protein
MRTIIPVFPRIPRTHQAKQKNMMCRCVNVRCPPINDDTTHRVFWKESRWLFVIITPKNIVMLLNVVKLVVFGVAFQLPGNTAFNNSEVIERNRRHNLNPFGWMKRPTCVDGKSKLFSVEKIKLQFWLIANRLNWWWQSRRKKTIQRNWIFIRNRGWIE